jgi:subtilisin-like proprotein convertase family protein
MLAGLVLAAGGWQGWAQTTDTHSFNDLNKAVPDGNSAGMSDTRLVGSPVVSISAVRVKLRVAGEFNGDLYAYLRHITPLATNYVVLLNRAGRTAVEAPGYDDAGLDVTFAADAGQDIHLYRDHATVPAGQPLAGTWQPDGRTSDPGSVLDTSPRATSLLNFAGMEASGEWTLFVADMESGGTNMLASWELEVTGAITPGVTWQTPASIVYGTELGAGQLNALAPVPGTLAYSPPAGAVLSAGTHTLTAVFTPDDPAHYVPATNTVLLQVTPAALTITAADQSKVYGAAPPELSANYSGFVNGDTESDLDSPPELSTGANASSPVGTYPIMVSGASDANYTITFLNGTLDVTPALLTIAAVDAAKKYGESLPAFTARYEGFVNSDTEASLAGTLAFSTTATESSDVGTYPIAPSGLSSPNYAIAFQPGNLSIQKAALAGWVSSSQNPALLGEAVTFAHTLTVQAPSAGMPTGSVGFKIDGSVVGRGTLSGGIASFVTSDLAQGTHTVVAEYAGNQNFVGLTNALSPDQFINRPPVAGADTIERYSTESVKVAIASLLSNDADPDGDLITFVSVAGTSENGATVVRSGNWIHYTPSSEFTSADSFTYEISDSRGARVTGTVTVAIKADDGPAMNLTIADLGNRSFRLRFDGVPLRAYTIHYSDSMEPPAWQPLTNIAASAFGIFECTNAVPEGVTQRFYRSSYP